MTTDPIDRILELCPVLQRFENLTEEIERMNKAYHLNGGTQQSEPIQIAILYLESLNTPAPMHK